MGSTVPGLEMDQCHPQCFPGIGGELICLFDDLVCDELPGFLSVEATPVAAINAPSIVDVLLNLSNTPASDDSVGLARENLGEELAPQPHQVGSILGGAKPPIPYFGS